MNEVEWLKSLDIAASSTLPVLNVTPGVMRAVRTRSMERDDDNVLPIAAAVAVIVGMTALMLASPGWFGPSASPEPFAAFGDAVNLVLR